MKFRNTCGDRFTLTEMADAITKFIREDKSSKYDLMIGSDSHFSKGHTNLATAVIIHRVGSCARLFITEEKVKGDLDICTKIINETRASIEIMRCFENSEFLYLVDSTAIHIDAGSKGLSNKVIKDCIHYVKGFGYDYEVKPKSFAATNVADKFTRK